MKNTLRQAFMVLRTKPFLFTALIVLTILAATEENWPLALALFLVILAEARVVILSARVKILSLVAGATLTAALGGLFRE